MLIYGRHAVEEALAGAHVERIFVARGVAQTTVRDLERAAKDANVPLEFVPRIDLDRALKTTDHQGIAAELPELTYADADAPFELAAARSERLLIVALDQITDPRNYGAIIRSAEALGAHGVVTEARRSPPLSATVAKAAAGAASHLPLVQVTNLPTYLEGLKERNVWVYGSAGDGDVAPRRVDWDRDVALVIGAEGHGMRRLVRERCDEVLHVRLRGRVGSLNASVAAGILLHEIVSGRAELARDA
ncbi:23S rRNA (guanosine(2251)-2'-O)-methyltransferase RlmB [soil metagenome]